MYAVFVALFYIYPRAIQACLDTTLDRERDDTCHFVSFEICADKILR